MYTYVKTHKQTHSYICTVEPLLKDTLNKGHDSYIKPFCLKQVLWSLQDHGNTILHNS